MGRRGTQREPAVSHAERWRRLEAAILRRPGALSADVRSSLANGRESPAPLARYAENVRRHAYRVTDDDIRALRASGYSEDQIFEATLALAFGAADERLRAGIDALRRAGEDGAALKAGGLAGGLATEAPRAADGVGAGANGEEE